MMKKLLLNLLLLLTMAIGAVAQQSLPYSYGFEDNDLSVDGWTAVTSNSNSGIYNSGAYDGTYLFHFQWNENPGYLVSPKLSGTENGVNVSFYYKNGGDYYTEQFQVGYTTDESATDPSTYTYGATIEGTSDWVLYENDFPAGTKYVAVKYIYTNGYYLNLDDFSFVAPASCAKPTELAAALTPGDGTIATLSWTENGTATAWTLEYGTAADFTGAVSENVTGTSSIDLTGLTAETTYYARVKAVCGAGDESAWSSVINFTPTDAYSITLNNETTTNSYVPVYGYYVDDYSRSQFIIPASALTNLQWGTITKLTFYSSNASIDWGDAQFDVRLAEVGYTTIESLATWNDMTLAYHGSLGISGNVMEITFSTPYYYMGGNLMIGVNETTSGEWGSCSWYGVTAAGASLGGYGSSISQQNFLPKVTIDYIPGEEPACIRPSGLAVSNIDINNATLTWSAGGSETAWQICINDEEDDLISVDANTYYTFTNLTAATTYNVKVRANCGGSNGDSDWTNNFTFTTALCPVENMCQISYELTESYDWGDGWYGAAINVIDAETHQILATWTLDDEESATGTLSVCNGRDITFEWVEGMYGGYYDSYAAYTVTDVNGDEIFSGEGALATVNYTVSCSSCRKPSDLQVSNITTTSADLVWTPGDNEEEWQICLNGDEEHLITADANGYTLTGLDELTNYTVKVRANCGAEQSGWITATFTTLSSCPAPEDVEVSDIASYSANVSWTAEANADSYIVRYRPLTLVQLDDFENGFGNNWTIYTEGDAGAKWRIIDPTGGLEKEAHSGDSVASAWSWNNYAYNADNWLVTSQIEMGGAVSFWANTNGPDYPDHFEVLLSLTGNQIADFTTTLRPMGTVTGDWSEVTIDLSGYSGMGYVAIHHVDYDANYLLIDDFGIYSAGEWVEADPTTETSAVISNLAANTSYQYQVASVCGADDDNWSASGSFTTLVSCPAPTNLTATNVTAHAATLSWTPNGNEDAWQISVGGDEENLISSDSNSFDLTNLDPETTYTVKVRAYCAADDQSAWTDEVTFTTLPTCVAPTTLTATNVTGHTATITWAAGAEETAWQVMVNDNDTDIVDVEDTPTYEMTGLTAETQYSVKVRAYCDVDDQSAWVNVNFTTLVACPAPTALAAHLTPGNGTVATLTWTENGTATAWTLEYGTAADFTSATSMDVTETPSVDLTGLTAETPYYARVKTVCGGIDGESAWSSVINFTPTDAYSITLNDGTETNSYVPVYGLWVDDYSRSQFIIPASDLTALQGATITKLTYYSSTTSTDWGVAEFDVRLAEVENTAIESLATWDDMTLAYHGSLGISGNVMEVTFDTPYTYMGGNLMIGTNETTSGSYASCSWYGVTATGASMGGYGTSISQRNFLPKVTIDFIPGAPRYTITATAGENGSIDPSGAVSVEEGADKAFTITADNGYRILSVVVDNADATAALVEDNGVYTYTFFDVAADHTINATFVSETAVTYTITATAGDNGTITPSGAVSVEEGADQPFEITPNANYEIDVLTVDSNEITLTEEQREGFTYTFPNVIAGHTINVTFRLATSVEINNAASMAVYPNPNNGMFSIDFSNIEGEATYQLIDARGAVVETRDINVTNGETKMFNHTLTAGTYFVRIIAGDKVYVEQIVVE